MGASRIPDDVFRVASQAAGVVREVLGPDARILWYGSWVRGTAVPRSDVDLAIAAAGRVPMLTMARLRERIEDLPTLRKIDLVDVQAVGDAMRDRILEEGTRL